MSKKAVIGIACGSLFDTKRRTFSNDVYPEAVILAGGLPMLIPCVKNLDFEEVINNIDALILTGGWDIEPTIYGEDLGVSKGVNRLRDDNEIQLYKIALSKNIPILGICRGIQVINVAAGGTLHQDIPSEYNKNDMCNHDQKAPFNKPIHSVNTVSGSLINKLVGDTAMTNSTHHQSVKDITENYVITATASDGIVEAIEIKDNNSVLGVQWHPEHMVNDDDKMLSIFEWLINKAVNK